jgi:hypothetical protein
MEKLEEIKKLFNTNKRGDSICFSLQCWTDGMWSVNVTDDWNTWLEKKVPMLNYKFRTPEKAMDAFLEHIKVNEIDVKKLQNGE